MFSTYTLDQLLVIFNDAVYDEDANATYQLILAELQSRFAAMNAPTCYSPGTYLMQWQAVKQALGL